MVKIVVGNRIGKNGRLAVGCSAFVFDDKREKVLLVRRADDGKWCVPGGFMESGENFSEGVLDGFAQKAEAIVHNDFDF